MRDAGGLRLRLCVGIVREHRPEAAGNKPEINKKATRELSRVAFEANCRSTPVPFALLSKRTLMFLVPDCREERRP